MKKIAFFFLAACMVMTGCVEKETFKQASVEKKNESILLVENNNKSIVVKGMVQTGTEMLSPLIVQMGNESKSYEWETIDFESFYPTIEESDLDGDLKKEVILVLTTGKGTGILESAVHVLRQDFTEIPVSDPIEAVTKQFKAELKKMNGELEYTITVAGKTYRSLFQEESNTDWFDTPVLGKVLRYWMQDGRLFADLTVQVSPGHYMGDVSVAYSYDNGSMKASEITFNKLEE